MPSPLEASANEICRGFLFVSIGLVSAIILFNSIVTVCLKKETA